MAIPDRIDYLKLGVLPRAGEQCTVHIDDRGRDGNHALFDFTVLGESGSIILQVNGYRNVIVAEAPVNAM